MLVTPTDFLFWSSYQQLGGCISWESPDKAQTKGKAQGVPVTDEHFPSTIPIPILVDSIEEEEVQVGQGLSVSTTASSTGLARGIYQKNAMGSVFQTLWDEVSHKRRIASMNSLRRSVSDA